MHDGKVAVASEEVRFLALTKHVHRLNFMIKSPKSQVHIFSRGKASESLGRTDSRLLHEPAADIPLPPDPGPLEDEGEGEEAAARIKTRKTAAARKVVKATAVAARERVGDRR